MTLTTMVTTVLLFSTTTHATSYFKFETYCRRQDEQVLFNIEGEELSRLRVSNITMTSSQGSVASNAVITGITPSSDPAAFTPFQKLVMQLEGEKTLTLTDIGNGDYTLELSSSESAVTSMYTCVVGIPKPGVIISN